MGTPDEETRRQRHAFKQYEHFRAALRWRAFSTYQHQGEIEMSNHNGGGAARTATREKVEFPINEPVCLTLDYDKGRLVQSTRSGDDQYQCTFNGGTHIAWFD